MRQLRNQWLKKSDRGDEALGNPNTVPRAAPSRHRRSAFQTYNPLRGTIDPVAAGCQLFLRHDLRNHEVRGEVLNSAHQKCILVIEVIGDRGFEAAAGQDGPHRALSGGRSGFRRSESTTR